MVSGTAAESSENDSGNCSVFSVPDGRGYADYSMEGILRRKCEWLSELYPSEAEPNLRTDSVASVSEPPVDYDSGYLVEQYGDRIMAILGGILNVDEELYEAAYIDGIHNRFQEIIYITIPQAKPQMLFGAVMAIVNTFQIGDIGVALSGANPTPGYAGQLIVTHIEDFGFIRYEMGYAAAVSVVLLIMMRFMSKGAEKLFGSPD